MKTTRIKSKVQVGIIVDTRKRSYMLGLRWDFNRVWELKASRFKLYMSNGVTGSFGVGKVWVWYGTWEV